MIEKRTLARPYAKAVFEIAKNSKDYERWSKMLALLSFIALDARVGRLLSDFTINPYDMADFFSDISGKELNDQGRNLLKLLASRRRLRILPEIAELYETFRNEAENTVDAECVTAVAASEQDVERFKNFIKSHLGLVAKMKCHIEPAILGGFVLRAGDKVIDGSLKGQIERLKDTMLGANLVKRE